MGDLLLPRPCVKSKFFNFQSFLNSYFKLVVILTIFSNAHSTIYGNLVPFYGDAFYALVLVYVYAYVSLLACVCDDAYVQHDVRWNYLPSLPYCYVLVQTM